MKAIALTHYLPSDHPHCFIEAELPDPTPGPQDLLVRLNATSVNPVDTKVRAPKEKVESSPRVLGWDAVGDVVAVGSEVTLFKAGDRVWYAGDISRPGSNSALQLVDERIAALAPKTLSDVEAAALPLTAITAWETLFERLGLSSESTGRLLIIGGAGGVGSIAIQLARRLTAMEVIATASRPETREWCLAMGAHQVVSHHDLQAELAALGINQIDAIFCTNATEQHWGAMASLIRPFGHICTIAESSEPWDLALLKSKSATFSQEFMFTRSLFQTPDMIEQHHLLGRVATLVDEGVLKTTLTKTLPALTPATLAEAHRELEAGRMIGKLVIDMGNFDR
ncbi:zinc-binding alcohol dehydrogenase family protein [Aeromonas taiwanensis]|uniref:Zinc-type alcohol dehydrogenase-like protein n=1 Tax=Aeromonas taiwanensis TaxID=633417 RepID=A0A5F0K6Z3_9GAMM|nr:zinc-binding alcohol dehydrogenase family protein [Aeromonas taiwanensis]TFF72318.1 zinc-binding alcohol dehydrogenase family protein [Aeromonas taiwanensis]TFF72882.1 zinc-binding alcohol dehydrogenase family protein [Aeromonas taiwanensis]TFF75701.1 zinc-binding alcohol dehydrogenase family protein [Aeromonas taiwanensis]